MDLKSYRCFGLTGVCGAVCAAAATHEAKQPVKAPTARRIAVRFILSSPLWRHPNIHPRRRDRVT